jgi:hypothetical protein
MAPKIEVSKFASGDLQILVRFTPSKNVRVEGNGVTTWVPTYDELNRIQESVVAIDEHNIQKKKKRLE